MTYGENTTPWFSAATLQPPHSSSFLLVAEEFIALLVLGTGAH